MRSALFVVVLCSVALLFLPPSVDAQGCTGMPIARGKQALAVRGSAGDGSRGIGLLGAANFGGSSFLNGGIIAETKGRNFRPERSGEENGSAFVWYPGGGSGVEGFVEFGYEAAAGLSSFCLSTGMSIYSAGAQEERVYLNEFDQVVARERLDLEGRALLAIIPLSVSVTHAVDTGNSTLWPGFDVTALYARGWVDGFDVSEDWNAIAQGFLTIETPWLWVNVSVGRLIEVGSPVSWSAAVGRVF